MLNNECKGKFTFTSEKIQNQCIPILLMTPYFEMFVCKYKACCLVII
jgi:hypothetical protein